MDIMKCRYDLKIMLPNGVLINDVQECSAFNVEGSMVIFYNIDSNRKHTVVAMYPAANLIIEKIREIK